MAFHLKSPASRAPVTVRPVVAAARPGHRRGPQGSPYKNGHDISLPVTLPMAKLPEDGEILTEDEMKCDPEERNCQTPMYVYEERCPACSGTGAAEARGRQRRLGACPMCGGIGYLRHVTSRYQPEVNGSLAGPTSLFRPKQDVKEVPKPKKYGEWN